MNSVHIDFESWSERDIKKVGSWRYSVDPTTEILCLGYAIGDDEPRIWSPFIDSEFPYDLVDCIDEGYVVKAWNVAFEYSMWKNVLTRDFGFPEVPEYCWGDPSAKAAAHGLPLSLENCGKVLKLDKKFAKFGIGKDLIAKFCKPQPRSGLRIMPQQEPKAFNNFLEYCKQDVVAERYIDKILLPLQADEPDFWHIDQVINRRGILIDVPSVHKISKRVQEQTLKANARLPALSNNTITKITQVKRIVDLCNNSGIKISNCQAQTVDKVLDYAEKNPDKIQDKHKNALEVLDIRKHYGKSATSKYEKMAGCVDKKNRVLFTMLYHGAHTGRWAGRLIQPHNYFKPTISKYCDSDDFVDCVANRSIECVETVYQPYIHAAASATRMMIKASDGHTFYIGDFNAIEARYVFWFADDKPGLDYYLQGRDPYCEMASMIFGRTITKADEFERFVGKGIVLGCGFGLGWKGFIHTMKEKWNTVIPESVAKKGINTYRTIHFKVVKMWETIDVASINAVLYPGQQFKAGKCTFIKPTNRDFLYCRLPSGRFLAFPEPRVEETTTSWGSEKNSLSYKTWEQTKGGWIRTFTYGGKTFENIVQGGARDLMAFGMTELEFQRFPITMTVHDELILELMSLTAEKDQHRVTEILETAAPWAPGMPIKVEAELSTRYKKA